MYNSGFAHQSQVFNNSYASNNPEVNDIIRRHEEIANNIKKIRSSSHIPASHSRTFTPVGSISNMVDDDNEVETIITTTTMKVTPQVRTSYAPSQQYQRNNNFLNNSNYSGQGSDLVQQLRKANQNILNISQDLRDFNDNVKRSQINSNSVYNSQYSVNNQPIVSPITRRDNFESFNMNSQPISNNNSQFLNASNNYTNPRSASVYSSRNVLPQTSTYQLPQTSTYHQSLYPASRGASQTRITEITTTTYEDNKPVPLHQFNSNLSNSRANLAYSQSHTPKSGTLNHIPSLNKIHDSNDNDNDYVKRIYVKGDGFEYEEIVDEENPQNNYKALRDAYHDEWQRVECVPEFVIPFLEIQEKQKNASNSISQLNMSNISGIPQPAKYDFRSNNHSRNFLDESNIYKSHADTSANVTHSYMRDVPTARSYIAQNPLY